MSKPTITDTKNFILNIAFLSFKNLFEPKIFKWILATVLLTLFCLSICVFIVSWFLISFFVSPFTSNIPIIGNYISEYIFFGVIITGFLGSIVLFAPLATIVFSLFQEKIIKEIEIKYYPKISQELDPKIFTMLYAGIKILGWSILINIILFPVSIIWGGSILWFPVYILIVGFLISKEYSEAINLRRHSFSESREIKNQFFWEYWISGIIGAILFFIPLINLLAAPYISILMLHILNNSNTEGPIADA